jgi:chromosome segregation ATPase
MLRRILIPLAAVLLAGGCTSGKTSVKATEVARLPQETSQQWQQQQLALIQAREEMARAEVAVNDAKREIEVAKSEVKVADAEIDSFGKMLNAAEKTRDDAAAQKARSDLALSRQKKQVAELHVDATEQQEKLAKQRQDLAKAQEELADVELNQAKYEALKAANDPAAQRYNPNDFARAISDKQGEVARLQSEIEGQDAVYMRARDTWEREQQLLQAATPSTPSG